MPRLSEMFKSDYLKQDDVKDRPMLLTIAGIEERKVQKDDETEDKWCAVFHETDKALVLNRTNTEGIQSICGDATMSTDVWIGKQIVLFYDPTIMFKGKRTGGVRIRAPKNRTPAPAPVRTPPPVQGQGYRQPPPVPTESDVDEVDPAAADDVPF